MTTTAKLGTRSSREQFCWDAVYKELELAGHDSSILQNDPNWFSNYTMTTKQFEQWKAWFLTESKKRFKFSKKMAEREFEFFNLQYGLAIQEEDSEN